MVCKGHQRRASNQVVHCAVPMQLEKVTAVVTYLYAQLTTPSNILSQLRSLRNICIFLFCWEGALRGVQATRVKWDDFFLDENGPQSILSQFLLPHPQSYSLCLMAKGVKTFQGKRAPAITFSHPAIPFSIVQQLHVYLALMHSLVKLQHSSPTSRAS
jgi:hypothetical protein